MRVHDSNLNAVTIGTRQTNRTDTVETGHGRGYDARGYGQNDRVSLSDLSNAMRAAGDDPARAERVSRLNAAYRSGSYKVDASAVAKGIVNDAMKVS